MSKIITFLTYESPWFPAGSIAAVMGQLPTAVQSAAKWPTLVITPFHNRATKISALNAKLIETIRMTYDGATVSLEILLHAADCHSCFLPRGSLRNPEARFL